VIRRLPLVVGPLLAITSLIAPPPAGLDPEAWRVAGIAAWMALWWLTAVVPLEATALIPLVLFPLVGVGSMPATATRYADPVIFLFLGGFLLAAALERWGLHRRLALHMLRRMGTAAPRVLLGLMLAAALTSMWVSNTATAVMLLPVALALAGSNQRLGGGFALGVAYGASIGGVATLIGTPPNALLAAAARELIDREVSFAGWMPIGLLAAIPLLAGAWWILRGVFHVQGEVEVPAQLSGRLPPLSGGDRTVLAVFLLTAAAWIFRGLADVVPGITDPGIAVAAGILLMALPLRGQRFATPLDWETARRIPWGVLLLFGGGLALAGAFETSGLSGAIGGALAGLQGVPYPVLLAATIALFVTLTELTSNTATAALGLPLIVGVANGLGLPAWPLMVAVALSCSMAFMLPVATPPNAIAYGSGALTVREMARAGWRLNILSVGVILVITLCLS